MDISFHRSVSTFNGFSFHLFISVNVHHGETFLTLWFSYF